MPFLYILSSYFFNCIEQAVFKPLFFPAYSTNIVIVIFNKWPPLLSDLSHPFAAHVLPFLLFLPLFFSGHTKTQENNEGMRHFGLSVRARKHCLVGRQDNGQCFIITVSLFPRYGYKLATLLKE